MGERVQQHCPKALLHIFPATNSACLARQSKPATPSWTLHSGTYASRQQGSLLTKRFFFRTSLHRVWVPWSSTTKKRQETEAYLVWGVRPHLTLIVVWYYVKSMFCQQLSTYVLRATHKPPLQYFANPDWIAVCGLEMLHSKTPTVRSDTKSAAGFECRLRHALVLTSAPSLKRNPNLWSGLLHQGSQA